MSVETQVCVACHREFERGTKAHNQLKCLECRVEKPAYHKSHLRRWAVQVRAGRLSTAALLHRLSSGQFKTVEKIIGRMRAYRMSAALSHQISLKW